MPFLGLVSLLCLIITGSIATLGVMSRHFNDNFGQTLGLSGVAIACFLRIPGKLANPDTPPELLLAQVSLCCFAVSTAWKLWPRRRLT